MFTPALLYLRPSVCPFFSLLHLHWPTRIKQIQTQFVAGLLPVWIAGVVRRPLSHWAAFLFIPANAWSLKLAATFSLLCLPSFRRPARTPGWIHFPLNYQNRAKSDRTASVEESLLPRPSHKGPSPSSGPGAEGWKRTSCPASTSPPHPGAEALSSVLSRLD